MYEYGVGPFLTTIVTYEAIGMDVGAEVNLIGSTGGVVLRDHLILRVGTGLAIRNFGLVTWFVRGAVLFRVLPFIGYVANGLRDVDFIKLCFAGEVIVGIFSRF